MSGDCILIERASKRKHTGYQYQDYGGPGILVIGRLQRVVPQSALGAR